MDSDINGHFFEVAELDTTSASVILSKANIDTVWLKQMRHEKHIYEGLYLRIEEPVNGVRLVLEEELMIPFGFVVPPKRKLNRKVKNIIRKTLLEFGIHSVEF